MKVDTMTAAPQVLARRPYPSLRQHAPHALGGTGTALPRRTPRQALMPRAALPPVDVGLLTQGIGGVMLGAWGASEIARQKALLRGHTVKLRDMDEAAGAAAAAGAALLLLHGAHWAGLPMYGVPAAVGVLTGVVVAATSDMPLSWGGLFGAAAGLLTAAVLGVPGWALQSLIHAGIPLGAALPTLVLGLPGLEVAYEAAGKRFSKKAP